MLITQIIFLYMKKQKAFTLIELLIVIAILGVLAVALLAALDPLEQIKKANDTGVRNQVSEIHGSMLRWYALSGRFPWMGAGTGVGQLTGGYITTNSPALSHLSTVQASGELKTNFFDVARNLDIIYMVGDENTVSVCFNPTSKSLRTADPNTKYDRAPAGVYIPPTHSPLDCNATGGYWGTDTTKPCLWCVQ